MMDDLSISFLYYDKVFYRGNDCFRIKKTGGRENKGKGNILEGREGSEGWRVGGGGSEKTKNIFLRKFDNKDNIF